MSESETEVLRALTEAAYSVVNTEEQFGFTWADRLDDLRSAAENAATLLANYQVAVIAEDDDEDAAPSPVENVDQGGRVVRKSASLSDCGRYRYSLLREWDKALPRLGVIMLNPSTADAEKDDPTIRKVVEFARRLGFGAVEVVNLFAYRATDPKALWGYHRAEGYMATVGHGNDSQIQVTKGRCAAFLCAWGADDARGYVRNRARWIESRVLGDHPRFVLGRTKEGCPRHPLYVPYSAVDWVREKYPQALPGVKAGGVETGGDRGF